MRLKKIAIDLLTVNPANDRHGELPTERGAIAWLFENKEQHMKNLAVDIARGGEIFEAPLVAQDGKKNRFIVYDGNRRVSCLKLLANPKDAPTPELRLFFEDALSNAPNGIPTSIECQVETSFERIEDILWRRHMGVQQGIGRSPWDDSAKQNFLNRTGRQVGVNISEEIENKLFNAKLLPNVGDLPRSNLKRLLSAEEFRNAVGLSLKKNQLLFTHEPDAVLQALNRIANDLITQRVVLGDLWNNDQKRFYLSDLARENVLPVEKQMLSTPLPFEVRVTRQKNATQGNGRSKPQLVNAWRDTLIRRDVEYNVTWCADTARTKDIWIELQSKLLLDRHLNAIAVLFRVLLELSVDNYIGKHAVGIHANDQLKNKVGKTATHLESRGLIDAKYHGEIRKFTSGEAIISANTMHRYVHSDSFAPSPKHLTAIWDVLSKFIVQCINAQ